MSYQHPAPPPGPTASAQLCSLRVRLPDGDPLADHAGRSARERSGRLLRVVTKWACASGAALVLSACGGSGPAVPAALQSAPQPTAASSASRSSQPTAHYLLRYTDASAYDSTSGQTALARCLRDEGGKITGELQSSPPSLSISGPVDGSGQPSLRNCLDALPGARVFDLAHE